MKSTMIEGITKCKVSDLQIGQRVDLEDDLIADTDNSHPEFQFEWQVVDNIVIESSDCILIEFSSGFACGFPPEHFVTVDGEQ